MIPKKERRYFAPVADRETKPQPVNTRRVDGGISQHEQHFIEMKPGDVMIIAPTDGHKPRCAVREGVPVRKIVVKVRADY